MVLFLSLWSIFNHVIYAEFFSTYVTYPFLPKHIYINTSYNLFFTTYNIYLFIFFLYQLWFTRPPFFVVCLQIYAMGLYHFSLYPLGFAYSLFFSSNTSYSLFLTTYIASLFYLFFHTSCNLFLTRIFSLLTSCDLFLITCNVCLFPINYLFSTILFVF